MDTELIDMFVDLKRIWNHQGYVDCKSEYCYKDEMAAQHEFNALIPLANKYKTEWKDLYGREELVALWDSIAIISWRIESKIIKEIKKINQELGDYCEC